jgi:hypothetical protein
MGATGATVREGGVGVGVSKTGCWRDFKQGSTTGRGYYPVVEDVILPVNIKL